MRKRHSEFLIRDQMPHPPVLFADKNVFKQADVDRVNKFPMNRPLTRVKIHIGEQERDTNDPVHLH